jgi:hypothetical protein
MDCCKLQILKSPDKGLILNLLSSVVVQDRRMMRSDSNETLAAM